MIGDVEGATQKMARAAAALHMLGHHDDAKVMPMLRIIACVCAVGLVAELRYASQQLVMCGECH